MRYFSPPLFLIVSSILTRFTMKKLFLATIVSLCALAPQSLAAAPQNGTVDKKTQVVEMTVVEEVTDIQNVAADQSKKAPAVSKKAQSSKPKLTREQRNKKIKEADSNGLGITIMSMAIVICSLILLSILFLAFGKISQSMQTKKRLKNYGIAHDSDNHEASSGEACAAIAAALYQYFNDRHDIEDTVLTMRKLKRAYSPWSSKLYGLRQTPERNNWHR